MEAQFFQDNERPAGIVPQAGLQSLIDLLVSTQCSLLKDKMPGFIKEVSQPECLLAGCASGWLAMQVHLLHTSDCRPGCWYSQ